MPFTYHRTVHFRDTDAAGVVYFANVLSICHEAYEASLAASGVDLNQFFRAGEVAVPIVHADVDFFQPMHCGDRLTIHLTPRSINDSEFEITYNLFVEMLLEKPASRATTRHVCINPSLRKREALSAELTLWLQAIAAPPLPSPADG